MFGYYLAYLFVEFVAFARGSGVFSSCGRISKSSLESLLLASSLRPTLASKDSTRASASNAQEIFGISLDS